MTLTPYAPAATAVRTGGVSLIAIYGPCQSGFLANPLLEQGIAGVEPLYYSYFGPASLRTGNGTSALQPGESISIPPNMQTNLWVNAATSGHKFSAIAIQPSVQYPPTSNEDTFPPLGPTSRQVTIPSYIYQQYNDDDSLIAFAEAYNSGTQAYVDWFNSVNLPIYTGLSGGLLDWVAAGLYGMVRPTLSSGRKKTVGPLNTWPLNTLALNASKAISKYTTTIVSDDVFKRILTWHLFKGDGKYFTLAWLKRRLYRFLFGASGTNAVGPFTSQISVNFGVSNELNITIIGGYRVSTQSAAFNSIYRDRAGQGFVMNGRTLNQCSTLFVAQDVPALSYVLQEALNCGILEFPFQYTPVVVVGT